VSPSLSAIKAACGRVQHSANQRKATAYPHQDAGKKHTACYQQHRRGFFTNFHLINLAVRKAVKSPETTMVTSWRVSINSESCIATSLVKGHPLIKDFAYMQQ
jgi:hypothetical protein